LGYLKLGGAFGDVNHEVLLLLFDHDRVLRGGRFQGGEKDLGFGVVAALSIDSIRVFNVKDYRKAADEHNWGARLLRALPALLNAEQDMSSGASGLEQHDTPTRAGQNMLLPEPKKRVEEHPLDF
jgi:hypothetical protein